MIGPEPGTYPASLGAKPLMKAAQSPIQPLCFHENMCQLALCEFSALSQVSSSD